jgi:hypothetical protein
MFSVVSSSRFERIVVRTYYEYENTLALTNPALSKILKGTTGLALALALEDSRLRKLRTGSYLPPGTKYTVSTVKPTVQ